MRSLSVIPLEPTTGTDPRLGHRQVTDIEIHSLSWNSCDAVSNDTASRVETTPSLPTGVGRVQPAICDRIEEPQISASAAGELMVGEITSDSGLNSQSGLSLEPQVTCVDHGEPGAAIVLPTKTTMEYEPSNTMVSYEKNEKEDNSMPEMAIASDDIMARHQPARARQGYRIPKKTRRSSSAADNADSSAVTEQQNREPQQRAENPYNKRLERRKSVTTQRSVSDIGQL